MHLTGWPSAAPLAPPVDVLTPVRAAADDLEDATGAWGDAVHLDINTVLFGRAALASGGRAGRTSVGGTCRILDAGDGWVAVNLARPTDVDSVPAIVGRETNNDDDPWDVLEAAAKASGAQAFVERAQLLGVPAARLGEHTREAVTVEQLGEPSHTPPQPPLVVDLSAMWAGPLCTRLLGDAGASVIKVESSNRPDGARAGDPTFYDWLHAEQDNLVLDFERPGGVRALRQLLAEADVVVEASRPRALRQRGIDADDIVRSNAG
jgi:hypothetical protein